MKRYNMSKDIAVKVINVRNPFNDDLSKWDVSNVELFAGMFKNSSFNGDISKWKINPKAKGNMNEMFTGSPLENTTPSWYYK